MKAPQRIPAARRPATRTGESPTRIAEGQRKVQRAGAILLVVLGVLSFAGGVALMWMEDTIPIEGLLCLEVGGVLSFLVGLAKLRASR
ncbi:MAG: hypothetical protein AB7S26_42070 [Sandaracinaceae bacterium]